MAPELLPTFEIWLICAVAVVLGTVIQKLSGAGFGMIASPVMALFAPAWLPGSVLLLGLAVGLGAVLGARDAVEPRDLPPGLAGRLTGAIIAAVIATWVVGTETLPIVVGCIVLFAVALSVGGLTIPINPGTLFGAGTVAGIMGTLTGIGAPPMAILYSTVESRRSAATQNTFFGFGMAMSIGALVFAGLIGSPHLAFAASLLPLVLITLIAVRPLVSRFERGAIRPWALGLATISALVLLFQSL